MAVEPLQLGTDAGERGLQLVGQGGDELVAVVPLFFLDLGDRLVQFPLEADPGFLLRPPEEPPDCEREQEEGQDIQQYVLG